MRHRIHQLLILALVVTVGVNLTGCQSLTQQANMGGTWYVTVTNQANDGYTGTMRFDIGQSGNNLSGTGFILGQPVGVISGTMSLSQFSFRLYLTSTYGGGYSDFTGFISDNSLSGNYTASEGGYGPISGSRSVVTSGALAPTDLAELLSRR